jgi:probable F420-dependent oxidoreductase
MSVRIGLGVAGFPFSSARAFLEWVDLCEDSPVDSIWISERLVSKQLQLEPMTAFGVIAGRTERIKFGMNAVVLPLRDPLVLAKECATLDFLSDGRLLPAYGVGGENAPEFRATGRAVKGRGAYSDEMLDIMARLWSEDDVTHHGQHFHYESVSISPKPVQQPLPLWIGGASPAAIRRTARVGTGWLAGLQTPAQVAPVVRAIKQAATEAGREIDPDHYGAGFPFRFGAWDEPVVTQIAAGYQRALPGTDPKDLFAVGDEQDIIARAREYVDAGISKFVLRPVAGSDEELRDQVQRLIDTVLPVVHEFQTTVEPTYA